MHKEEKKARKLNPYVNASIISKLTYWYLKDLFKMGLNRTITIDDIYETIDSHRSSTETKHFEKYWKREKLSQQSPSLIRCISKMYYKSLFILGFLLAILDTAIRIVSPLCLGGLISYFTPDQKEISKNEAYLYAAGIILCSIHPLYALHPYNLYLSQVALKLKMSVRALIYRKCLKLTRSKAYDGMNGHVINLMTIDVNRLDIINCIHDLWKGPFELCLLGYFIYREMGISALVGLGFILSFIPLQVWLGKMLAKFTTNLSQRTDNRVRFMNEILQGIQVIKMYAWENLFSKIVDKVRRKEISAIRKRYNLLAIHYSITIVGKFALFLTLFCYVKLGQTLDARKVFVTSVIFSILDLQMVLFWPEAIKLYAECYVAMKRIKTFLLLEEEIINRVREEEKEKLITAHRIENSDAVVKGIVMKNVSAVWNKDTRDRGVFLLDLTTTTKNLTAIIGKVGSGKSSLINAILGELELIEGSIEVNGQISYAAQEPWLFEGTIRQNIVFVEKFDESRYKQVCRVCALERDFELLPNGDGCVVGERGVILSGGQKVRVSLARTVYKIADIYLLDDPFSAVDVNVGRQIFSECIEMFLKSKCVILVTHQLQFIQNIEHIIYMNAGRIELQGGYQKIAQLKLDEILNLSLHTETQNIVLTDQTIENDREFVNKSSCSNQETEEEQLQEGSVALKLFKIYFKSMNCTAFIIAAVAVVFFGKLLTRGLDYFLSEWVNWEDVHKFNEHFNETVAGQILENRRDYFLNVYTVLMLFLLILTVAGYISFFSLALRASRNLHDKMFKGIIRAAMTFFNNNSSGRILNRFSRDINVIDNDLPLSLIDTVLFIMDVTSIVALIVMMNCWLLIPTILMCLCFLMVRYIYINTSRCITRLNALTHSPVLAHANATLQGLSTIRSQKAEKIIANEFDKIQDLNTTISFMFKAASTAFAFWLNFICILYIGFVTISFLVFEDFGVYLGGSVGAAITVSLGLLSLCQWGMSRAAELELSLIGVERVNEYIDLPSEPPLETSAKLASTWPTEGKIEFDHLYFRYTPNGEFILKDLHFLVQPQEKIGVIGRTGAGKSSIVQALFRLAHIDGTIKIDNVDINTLGLHDLRRKLAIIPQTPILFSGSLRMNLDPFEEKSDFEIYEALEKVEMKKFVTNLSEKLEFKVSDDGSNFSTGQKQLICLARAILRNNNILILDEATANIDLETDNLIQRTIREHFTNYTVITIAHRLNTIIDSDRIVVMDGGKIVEFDHPHTLLSNPDGHFRKLVNQTGQITCKTLKEIAKTNYSIRKNPISWDASNIILKQE